MRPFVAKTLAKTYLFQDLNVDQIDHIASLCETEVGYEKGSYIIHEGDRGVCVCVCVCVVFF